MPEARIGLKTVSKVMSPDKIPHILKPGELGAVLEWVVYDPKTDKIIEHKVKKSESFLQQFLQLLFVKMAMSPVNATVSIRDISNTLRNVYILKGDTTYFFRVDAGAGTVDHGIIIGTSNVAPTISDFAIGVIIPHATMNYSATVVASPAADATTSQVTITRNFSNVSGGPVTVEEVALYCRAWDGVNRYFCIIRDVTGGIVVPNGVTLTVNYRPQAVV